MPLTMGSLVLIAASFVFGPLRTVAAGTRVFYGVVTGLSFKYVQDLLAPASTILAFPRLGCSCADLGVCRGRDLFSTSQWLMPQRRAIRDEDYLKQPTANQEPRKRWEHDALLSWIAYGQRALVDDWVPCCMTAS